MREASPRRPGNAHGLFAVILLANGERQAIELHERTRDAWLRGGDANLLQWARALSAGRAHDARPFGQYLDLAKAADASRPIRVVAASSPQLACYYASCLDSAREPIQ